MVDKLRALRRFYSAENKIGLMIDELIADLESGAPRDEIRQDAEALRAEIDPESTAFKMIGEALEALASSTT